MTKTAPFSSWMRTAAAAGFIALATASCATVPRTPASPSTRASAAARVLSPYFEGSWMLGASVAFVDARGVEYFEAGSLDGDGRRSPDENTIYEIGSLTKTFTALLLMQMAEEHLVSLDQSVQSLLPAEVPVSVRGARAMSLLDLATHYSGLPREPGNLSQRDPNDPYADYTTRLLYDFLSGYAPARESGVAYEYSNLGFGLLGQVLSRRAGSTFEDAVRARVCAPLGLNDTTVTLSNGQQRRLAPAHDADLQSTANWTLGALEGAGGLRSTAHDLARYAETLLGTTESSLGRAARAQTAPRRNALHGRRVGIAWLVEPDGTISHGGLTGGYAAEMRVDLTNGVAAILLTNTGLNVRTDALGEALLEVARGGTPPAPWLPREVAAAVDVLDGYTGDYAMAPDVTVSVSRSGGHLVVVAPAERKIILYPSASGGFFARLLDLTVTFEHDERGGTVMVVTESGRERRIAKR